MGIYETRPARPNSIELRRSYQSEQIDGVYGPLSPQNAGGNMMTNAQGGSQYATTAYAANGMHPSQQMQQHQGGMGGMHHQQQQSHLQQQQHQQQQMYDDALYHQSHALYGQTGQGPMSPEPIYAPGTPSRTKPRPSQPPPAPPSNGSGGGTPTASSANTPTRGRSMSTSRDALPPPPPIPDGMINTTSPSQMLAQLNGGGGASGHIAAKLLARTNSTSRAGSPQLAPSNSVQDANALVMQQLNNTINSFNSMTMGGGMQQQMNSMNDLPPPPPVPDQVGFSCRKMLLNLCLLHIMLHFLLFLFFSTNQSYRHLMRRHHHLLLHHHWTRTVHRPLIKDHIKLCQNHCQMVIYNPTE